MWLCCGPAVSLYAVEITLALLLSLSDSTTNISSHVTASVVCSPAASVVVAFLSVVVVVVVLLA